MWGVGVGFYDLDVCSLVIHSHRKPMLSAYCSHFLNGGKNLHNICWLLFLILYTPDHVPNEGSECDFIECPSLIFQAFLQWKMKVHLIMSPLIWSSVHSNNQVINVSVIEIRIFLLFCINGNISLFVCLVDHFHGYPSMVELDTSFHITILIH